MFNNLKLINLDLIKNSKFKIKNLTLLLFLVLSSLFIVSTASAAPRYPIPELGYCASAQECFYYCQIPQNTPACWAYGKYINDSQVLGETDASSSGVAQKFGITFPIAQLGNCSDVAECRQYCSLKENYTACSDFGLKKGLSKARQAANTADMKKILSYAKKDLRCSTQSSCREYCQIPANQKLCHTFAVKNKLIEDTAAVNQNYENKLLGYAKNELGCTSTDSCHLFCQDPTNREKCFRFSRKFAVNPQASGSALPLASELNRQNTSKPCATDETCKLYCRNNPLECPGYGEIATSASKRATPAVKRDFQSGDFLGPSGCKTDAECGDFCRIHPAECPSVIKSDSIISGMVKITPTLKPTSATEF